MIGFLITVNIVFSIIMLFKAAVSIIHDKKIEGADVIGISYYAYQIICFTLLRTSKIALIVNILVSSFIGYATISNFKMVFNSAKKIAANQDNIRESNIMFALFVVCIMFVVCAITSFLLLMNNLM